MFYGYTELQKYVSLRWNPNAIVFNSSQQYGTPSYWMQRFFRESSGAAVHDSTLNINSSNSLVASAITWHKSENNKNYLRIKVVNFGSNTVSLRIRVDGLEPSNVIKMSGSTKTVLTSGNLMDENSFTHPNKVTPAVSRVENADEDMDIVLSPHSFTSLDLLRDSIDLRITQTEAMSESSSI